MCRGWRGGDERGLGEESIPAPRVWTLRNCEDNNSTLHRARAEGLSLEWVVSYVRLTYLLQQRAEQLQPSRRAVLGVPEPMVGPVMKERAGKETNDSTTS